MNNTGEIGFCVQYKKFVEAKYNTLPQKTWVKVAALAIACVFSGLIVPLAFLGGSAIYVAWMRNHSIKTEGLDHFVADYPRTQSQDSLGEPTEKKKEGVSPLLVRITDIASNQITLKQNTTDYQSSISSSVEKIKITISGLILRVVLQNDTSEAVVVSSIKDYYEDFGFFKQYFDASPHLKSAEQTVHKFIEMYVCNEVTPKNDQEFKKLLSEIKKLKAECESFEGSCLKSKIEYLQVIVDKNVDKHIEDVFKPLINDINKDEDITDKIREDLVKNIDNCKSSVKKNPFLFFEVNKRVQETKEKYESLKQSYLEKTKNSFEEFFSKNESEIQQYEHMKLDQKALDLIAEYKKHRNSYKDYGIPFLKLCIPFCKETFSKLSKHILECEKENKKLIKKYNDMTRGLHDGFKKSMKEEIEKIRFDFNFGKRAEAFESSLKIALEINGNIKKIDDTLEKCKNNNLKELNDDEKTGFQISVLTITEVRKSYADLFQDVVCGKDYSEVLSSLNDIFLKCSHEFDDYFKKCDIYAKIETDKKEFIKDYEKKINELYKPFQVSMQKEMNEIKDVGILNSFTISKENGKVQYCSELRKTIEKFESSFEKAFERTRKIEEIKKVLNRCSKKNIIELKGNDSFERLNMYKAVLEELLKKESLDGFEDLLDTSINGFLSSYNELEFFSTETLKSFKNDVKEFLKKEVENSENIADYTRRILEKSKDSNLASLLLSDTQRGCRSTLLFKKGKDFNAIVNVDKETVIEEEGIKKIFADALAKYKNKDAWSSVLMTLCTQQFLNPFLAISSQLKQNEKKVDNALKYSARDKKYNSRVVITIECEEDKITKVTAETEETYCCFARVSNTNESRIPNETVEARLKLCAHEAEDGIPK